MFHESERILMTPTRPIIRIDRRKWKDRKDFICTVLSFCLSISNLWRFPKQAYLYGQGTFVILYIAFTIIFGSALLYFEVILGQLSKNELYNVFSICPVFKGIIFSMAAYCAIVSIYYNALNVESLLYVFASFSEVLPYAKCIKQDCNVNSTNQTSTPEYVFHKYHILYYEILNENNYGFFDGFNWRNVGLLFLLWTTICVAIVLGIRTLDWPFMITWLLPITALFATFLAMLPHEGSFNGLLHYIQPKLHQMRKIEVWAFAFEQTIISLGLGTGTVVNFGTYVTYTNRTFKDTVIICVVVTLTTLLSGATLFGIMGMLAYERNVLFDDLLSSSEVCPLVLFSQLFVRLKSGWSQVMSFFFFLVFTTSGWFPLISYTETIIVTIYGIGITKHKTKVKINVLVCFFGFALGTCLEHVSCYQLKAAIDFVMVGPPLILILLFEIMGTMYIHGFFNFVDDINLILSLQPTSYHYIIWISCPLLFIFVWITYVLSMCRSEKSINFWCIFAVMLVSTVGPVIFSTITYFYRRYYKQV